MPFWANALLGSSFVEERLIVSHKHGLIGERSVTPSCSPYSNTCLYIYYTTPGLTFLRYLTKYRFSVQKRRRGGVRAEQARPLGDHPLHRGRVLGPQLNAGLSL